MSFFGKMVLKSVFLLFLLIWTISSTYGPADARMKGHHNKLQESSIETNFHNRSKNNCENVAGQFINSYNRKTYSTFAECQNTGLAVLRTRRNANRRRVQSKRTVSRRKQTKSRPRRPGPNSKNKKQKIKSFGIAPNKKNLKPKGRTRGVLGNRQRKNHVRNNRKKGHGKGVRPKGKIPSRKRAAQSQNKYHVRLGGKAIKISSSINGTIKRKFPSGSPRKTRKKSGIKDRKIKKVKIASKTTAQNKTKGKTSNRKWQIVNLQGLKLDMNSLKYKVRNGKCYEIYQGKKRNGKEKPYRRQLAKSESSCYVYKYADSAKKTCLKKVITGQKIKPVVVPIEKCANAEIDKPISRGKFGKFEINGNKCYHIYKDRKGIQLKKIANEYQCYRYEYTDSSKTVCKKVPETGQKFESVVVPVAKCGKRNAKVKAVNSEKPMSDEPETTTTVPETAADEATVPTTIEAEPTTTALPDTDSMDSESGKDTTEAAPDTKSKDSADSDTSEAETPSPTTPEPETTTADVPEPEPKIFYMYNDETGYCEEHSEKDLKDSTTVSDSGTQSDQPVANNRHLKNSKLKKNKNKIKKKVWKNNAKRRPNVKRHPPKGRIKPKPRKNVNGMPSIRPKDRKTARSRNSPKTKPRISPSARSRGRPNIRTRIKPISKYRNKPNTRPRVKQSANSRKRTSGRSKGSPSARSRVKPIVRPKSKPKVRLVAKPRSKPRSKSNRRPKKSRSRIKRMTANVRRHRNTKYRIKRPLRPVQRKRIQSRSRKHMTTVKRKRSTKTYNSMQECQTENEKGHANEAYVACYPKCKTNSGPYYCTEFDYDCKSTAEKDRENYCRTFRSKKRMRKHLQTKKPLPNDVKFIRCEGNSSHCQISDNACYPYFKDCYACDKEDYAKLETESKISISSAYRCWKDCKDEKKEYCKEIRYDECREDGSGNPPCYRSIYSKVQDKIRDHPTPDGLRVLKCQGEECEEQSYGDTCYSDTSCKKCNAKVADSILKKDVSLICRPNCFQSGKEICKKVYDDDECKEYMANQPKLTCRKMGNFQAEDLLKKIPDSSIKAVNCDDYGCSTQTRCEKDHKNCTECDDENMFNTKVLGLEPTTPMLKLEKCNSDEKLWKIISEEECKKYSDCEKKPNSKVSNLIENNYGYKFEKYLIHEEDQYTEISEGQCFGDIDKCKVCSDEDYKSMQDPSYLVTTTLSPEEKNAPLYCKKVGWNDELTFKYCKEVTKEECEAFSGGECLELSTKDKKMKLDHSIKPTHFVEKSGYYPYSSYNEMTEEECMKNSNCNPCTAKLCRDAFIKLKIITEVPDTTTAQPPSLVDTTTAPPAQDTTSTVVPLGEENVVSDTTTAQSQPPVDTTTSPPAPDTTTTVVPPGEVENVISETTTANPTDPVPTTTAPPKTEKNEKSEATTPLPVRQPETTTTIPIKNPTTTMPRVPDTTTVSNVIVVMPETTTVSNVIVVVPETTTISDVIVVVPETTTTSAKPLPTTTPKTNPSTTTPTTTTPLITRSRSKGKPTTTPRKDTVCKIASGPKKGLCFLLSKARERAFQTKVGEAPRYAGKVVDTILTAWHTPVKQLLGIGSGALKKDINQRTVIWTFMNLNGRDRCEVIMRDLPVSDETFIGIAKRCSHKEFKNIEDDDGLDYYD